LLPLAQGMVVVSGFGQTRPMLIGLAQPTTAWAGTAWTAGGRADAARHTTT
jgi:hypothetical protein